MLRKVTFILIAAFLMAAVLGTWALAQTAGVKGNGAIALSNDRLGMFDVRVGQSGSVISGGFKYIEYQPNSTAIRPTNQIYSQTITSLQVVGNYAKVQAVGFWNGQLSDLIIEVRDNAAPGLDWFHITAKPRGMILVIYDAAGNLVKGDLAVFGTTTAGYTTGTGTIKVGVANIGNFQFKAQQTPLGPVGQAYYIELSPSITTNALPLNRIYLPAVKKLSIVGNTAVLSGPGTWNGRPAFVEIKAVDNYNPMMAAPFVKPDEFYITATPMLTTIGPSLIIAQYSAGGPLVRGDLAVVSF